MAETKKVAEMTAEEKIRKEQEDLFKKAIQLNVNDHNTSLQSIYPAHH